MNEKKNESTSRVDGVRESEIEEESGMRQREELLMNELKISIDIFFSAPSLSRSCLVYSLSRLFISLFTQIFSAHFSICHICLFRILSLLSSVLFRLCLFFGSLKHCFSIPTTWLNWFIVYVLLFFSRNFKPLKMARITEKNHHRQRQRQQQHNYLNK